MLTIIVPGTEMFDDESQEFVTKGDVTLELEHSLVSLSKWESKHEKPFLGKIEKTGEEVLDYVRCMILTPNVSEEVLNRLSQSNIEEINAYIEAKMSATWFNEPPGAPKSRDVITAELVYYWMTVFQIPFECEHWHLNRLFTLIRICNIKQAKPKKMSRGEIGRRQRELNAQRKEQLGTRGEMAPLVWDEIGERLYQTGVDRGVLYLHDETVVPWNGLTEIDEDSSSEVRSFYLDGVKYLENFIPGDFSAKLKAFTYPDEFDSVNGVVSVTPEGLSFYNQPSKSFNLSYRTRIGNDLSSEHGYKIHILYNVIANPDGHAYSTMDDSGVQPIEFSWSLTGTPSKLEGFRPTVHISIDSLKTPSDLLEVLENILYGTDSSNPRLPTMQELALYFGYIGALIIIDNGDGTWTAVDESNTYITMLNDTTFQIVNADATYLDVTTYEISSTNVGEAS